MDSQEVKIGAADVIVRLLSIAVLVFLLMKSQAALTKAKEGLAVVEPVWKTGEATSGVATADGPVTKTRIFFKAQEVTLEYNVNGVPYTCRTKEDKEASQKASISPLQLTREGLPFAKSLPVTIMVLGAMGKKLATWIIVVCWSILLTGK